MNEQMKKQANYMTFDLDDGNHLSMTKMIISIS
jgi:hypothetical protein